MTIDTPCIRQCQIDRDRNLCTGCLRTLDEIAAWGRMTPPMRRRIMAQLPDRQRKADAQTASDIPLRGS